jgi:trimeric autotransporter adhesin
MRSLSIIIGLIFFLLAGLPLTVSADNSRDRSAASLKQFLDETGRLLLPDDFVGSIDPTGFRLKTDSDGTPLFVQNRAGNATPGDWDAFGGIETGCGANSVNAIAYAGDNQLFIGGSFGICAGTAANNIVRLDLATGEFHALGESALNGVNDGVRALAVSGSDLFVGGFFTEAGGLPTNFVARWDGSTWHALGQGVANGFFDRVSALALSGTDLFVGGRFIEAGSSPAHIMARWDGSTWHMLNDSSINGVNNEVKALAVSGPDLFAAGSFIEVGGQSVGRIARCDSNAPGSTTLVELTGNYANFSNCFE